MNPLLNDDKNEEYSVQTKSSSTTNNNNNGQDQGKPAKNKNNENRQHHNYRMQFQTPHWDDIYTTYILKMDNIQRVFFCC